MRLPAPIGFPVGRDEYPCRAYPPAGTGSTSLHSPARLRASASALPNRFDRDGPNSTAIRRSSTAGYSAATFGAFLALFWVASGSSLDALPAWPHHAWLHQTSHIVLSCTDAMAIDVEKGRLYLAAAALMISAAALIVVRVRRFGGTRGTSTANTSCSLLPSRSS
ncbi:MAG: hypothetical protein M3P18_20625 [Actinomycetota bacterium]|nr:hypothetical protein [Actinomycetota bacterium]